MTRYLLLTVIAFGLICFGSAESLAQDKTKENQKKSKSDSRKSKSEKSQKQKGKNKNPKTAKQKKTRVHESLNGVLWTQTSLEYQMCCKQAYALATLRLKENLKDETRSAALEQVRNFSDLPPAVILDIDETVLDNSPFQARVAEVDDTFQSEKWAEWVNEAKAKPIPGAAEFIKHAQELGVTVVFVTNRTADLEDKTIENLNAVLDGEFSEDLLLCKNERADWGSNKSSRRRFICESYRVISLIGDDYNDFAWIGKSSPDDRVEIGSQFEAYWHQSWFLLPNPHYGNWEKAIYGYDYSLERDDVLKLKNESLNSDR